MLLLFNNSTLNSTKNREATVFKMFHSFHSFRDTNEKTNEKTKD